MEEVRWSRLILLRPWNKERTQVADQLQPANQLQQTVWLLPAPPPPILESFCPFPGLPRLQWASASKSKAALSLFSQSTGTHFPQYREKQNLSLSLLVHSLGQEDPLENPLQYSCLEKSIDRGVWWAAVPGVTKSQTQLSNQHFISFLLVHHPLLLLDHWLGERHESWVLSLGSGPFGLPRGSAREPPSLPSFPSLPISPVPHSFFRGAWGFFKNSLHVDPYLWRTGITDRPCVPSSIAP